MEKIYDESQQQKRQQQQKKKIKMDGVSMLSFAVAIFAVVSLVAAGVSGFSYALPENVVELPPSFDGVEENSFYMYDPLTKQAVDYHYYLKDGTTKVPLMCLQRKVDFTPGKFTKVNENSSVASDDVGLLYLLANLAPNGTITYPGLSVSGDKKTYLDFWVSQMTIWYYLNGKDDSNTGGTTGVDMSQFPNVKWLGIGDEEIDLLPSAANTCDNSSYCLGYTDNSKTIYENATVNGKTIKQLVETAKTKTGIPFSISLSDGEGTITTDADKKFYFSPLYTVVSSIDNSVGELKSYELTVTATDKDGKSVDVGAVVTDKDGNVKENTTNLTPAELSTFYVRVPAEKVDKNVTVHVGIMGNFRMYDGARYKVASAGESQEVTTVGFTTKSTPAGKDFDLAPAPDTGINAGQTIYFIGLIVLLCGVGIIYANAKPAKVQAQN